MADLRLQLLLVGDAGQILPAPFCGSKIEQCGQIGQQRIKYRQDEIGIIEQRQRRQGQQDAGNYQYHPAAARGQLPEQHRHQRRHQHQQQMEIPGDLAQVILPDDIFRHRQLHQTCRE